MESSWSLESKLLLSSKRPGETDMSGVCEASLLSLSLSEENEGKLGISGVESRLESDSVDWE